MLACELYLAATDLDTCERIVLGGRGLGRRPDLRGRARLDGAADGLPARPACKDRELVDGGIVSTTNLDIAVEAGAKLIVVVNPLVPYVNDFTKEIPTLFGTRARRVSDMGFPKIGYQTFKLLAYQRLHEIARDWSERYPGVDIVLIEPDPDDELMFQTNILNYRLAARRRPPRLPVGDRQARRRLRRDRARSAARHGIEISATRVRKVVRHFEAEQGEKTRRLAADPRADHRRAAAPVGRRLTRRILGAATYWVVCASPP